MRKISEGHLKLYEYMQDRHDNGEPFTKPDLLEIYSKFVIANKRIYDYREWTAEQIYNHASTWLNTAISILIRRGYLGLVFRKNCVNDVNTGRGLKHFKDK